ncbi:MAG TPA: hypothetical protein VMM93_12270 [Vicinamibacterales bacterium]|nr:hypothetical protein [Vicinamibacterales bacterium]
MCGRIIPEPAPDGLDATLWPPGRAGQVLWMLLRQVFVLAVVGLLSALRE